MSGQKTHKRALLVAGMHRSGTSALTRVINLHGAELGSQLPKSAFDNETGFWENQTFVDFHERLLAHLDSSWDDPRPLPEDWLANVVDAGYRDELCRLIDAEFGGASLWAVKDPRICRFIPLWLSALDLCGVTVGVIIALRDPSEVAGSLIRRNGLSPAAASTLWLRHLAESVEATGAVARCMVIYDFLLSDWNECMQFVSKTLGFSWPTASVDCAAQVDAHLDTGLRHESFTPERDVLPQTWRDEFRELYAMCCNTGHTNATWSVLQNRLEVALAPQNLCSPLIRDLQPKSIQDKLQTRLNGTAMDRDAFKAEAQRLYDESEGHVRQLSQTFLQLGDARTESSNAKHELEVAKHQLGDTREQLTSSREDVDRVQQQLTSSREDVDRVQQQLTSSREDMDRVQQQLASSRVDVDRVQQQLDERSQEVDAAIRRIDGLEIDLAEKSATLVHLRGELVKAKARIHLLEHVQNELHLIRGSRSWRWTRPIRVLMRIVRNRGLSAEDCVALQQRFTKVSSSASRAAAGTPQSPAALQMVDKSSAGSALVLQTDAVRDYFVFSVIDWHFRTQRPQHMARELAGAGHRVFYISNNFVDSSSPGFAVESLNDTGRLFQVRLHLHGAPAIYHAPPSPNQLDQLRASMATLLEWSTSFGCAAIVQHPYWLETARDLPDSRLVYDCMDHHGGFADNTPEVLARERELMQAADLLVVTSEWLFKKVGAYNPDCVLIRNACEYKHFSVAPRTVYQDPQGRHVIGYYGAIAEWFDLDLVEKVAVRFPDCLVLLVGADTTGAQDRLGYLENVEFTGEVTYAALPGYLAAIDVCLLPFQVIPLTLATNPVKVYEYLSAGKEVVSIDLPEIRQFGELVRTAADHAGFLNAVEQALLADQDSTVVAQRRKFAAGQTWAHRAHSLAASLEGLPEPRVSIIVVTYNNLELTKACLDSLARYSNYHNLEVIVVDNASVDGTPAFLTEWAAKGKDRRIVLNQDNRGFAAANNQGLAIADGDYLVLLNNDTYVTPGWVATLIGHLRRNEQLGMIGPVTNNIGNEARIKIEYSSMEDMLQVAGTYTRQHAGQLTPLRTAAFFCVMFRRSVYEAVGPLDEVFGIGFFEDDDYCRRVEQAGWSIVCADDVFVHHNLSASFNKLKQETRQALFEQNKATYEAKWGTWESHKYRD